MTVCYDVQEVCRQYWPSREEDGEGASVTHGDFTITAGGVKHGTLTQRAFIVVHNAQVNMYIILHYKAE